MYFYLNKSKDIGIIGCYINIVITYMIHTFWGRRKRWRKRKSEKNCLFFL